MDTITCCFTGHRLQKLPFRFNETDPRCLKLKKILASEVERLIEEKASLISSAEWRSAWICSLPKRS